MKAVIPAAGLGTRLLPATKSMPKEMLPVVDRPVIQYVVEEAVAAGIDEILLVTGRGKRAIEDHFDVSFELEAHLREQGKQALLDVVESVSGLAKIHYVRQPRPLGLGHAVLCAEHFVDDEPFAVLLGDDIIYGDRPATEQLVEVHERTGASCFTVMRVSPEEIGRYGAVDPGDGGAGGDSGDDGAGADGLTGVHPVEGLVEKPDPGQAPSNLATIGRYVFEPEILDCLREITPGHGGELQLTDAMALLAERSEMHAVEFEGTRLDVGNVLGFLTANLRLGLQDPDVGDELRAAMRELLDRG